MRHQLLPAHRVQVRRVNEAVPRGGVGHHKYKWSFVSVCVQCVCVQCVRVVQVPCSVCALCLCPCCVQCARIYIRIYAFTLIRISRRISHAQPQAVFPEMRNMKRQAHCRQPQGEFPPSLRVVTSLVPSRLARRPSASAHVSAQASKRLGRATRSSHTRTRTRTARRYQVAHTHTAGGCNVGCNLMHVPQ